MSRQKAANANANVASRLNDLIFLLSFFILSGLYIVAVVLWLKGAGCHQPQSMEKD
jgi:hypothetical protein